MKTPCASFFSLLLAASSLGADQKLLEPLNLETVVIRGQATNPAIRVRPEARRQTETEVRRTKTSPKADLQPRLLRLKDTLELSAGRFGEMEASNSMLLQYKYTSLGLNNRFSQEDGHRDGCGRGEKYHRLEWGQRNASGLNLTSSLSSIRRDLDLPVALSQPKQKLNRTEEIYALAFQLQTPEVNGTSTKWWLEHHDAQQTQSSGEDFHQRFFRLGGILKKDGLETAISVEFDRKNEEQTTLFRGFAKGFKQTLDHRTGLHIGLGMYALSSKEGNIDNTGFFSLENDEKNTTVAFSPYLRAEHLIRKDLILYASYTQFYQSVDQLETFFDKPDMSSPSLIVQPFFDVQVESGLKWSLSDNWRAAFSYEWHKYRDRPILVIDPTNGDGRTNLQTWDRGREEIANLYLRGELENWSLEGRALHRNSSWDFPNIDFTPYLPEWEFNLDSSYEKGPWFFRASYVFQQDMKAYPLNLPLSDRKILNLSTHYTPMPFLTLMFDLENALDADHEVTYGYPGRPWSARFGMKARL